MASRLSETLQKANRLDIFKRTPKTGDSHIAATQNATEPQTGAKVTLYVRLPAQKTI